MSFRYIKVKTKGQNEGEKLLVPKLRFKEFKDEWKTYNLKQILEIKNGLNKEKASFGTGTPIINYMDVNKNEILTANKIKGLVKLSEKEIENFRVHKGDIFFTRTSETSDEIGLSAALIEEINDCVFSGFILKATPIKNIFDNLFSGYYFRTYKLRKEIIKHSSITTRALTSGSLLYGMSINIPNINEQSKIGKTLYLLDQKIELQQKKIEALKIYKKGLIQRIYNRTCNNKIKMEGVLIQKSIRNANNEIHNVYSVSNKDGFILQTKQFKDRIVASEDTRNYKVIEKNDFAYNPARINVGSIARMKQDIKGIISPMYICFKCNEKILPEYLEYFFESSKFTYEMSKRLEGSVRMCLSYESMLNIPIELPNKKEQEKISTFLNSLSNKIKLEEKKFMELNKLKKGLLQKMFI